MLISCEMKEVALSAQERTEHLTFSACEHLANATKHTAG